ncbi:MAG: hypothetical protein K2W85_13175 [Phycisphaerales bacterium]|nr:hypothetical protein [Phycisphaerales bacterium]
MTLRRAFRFAVLGAVFLILGFATAIITPLALALVYPPVKSFRFQAIAYIDEPFQLGTETFTGNTWEFDEQRRVGMTSLAVMTMPQTERPNFPLIASPDLSPEIDWFMFRSWLPHRVPETGSNKWIRANLYGWPFRSLWYGTIANTGFPQTPPWTRHGYGAISAARIGISDRFLPSRVLWHGLIANTVVFSVAIGVLTIGLHNYLRWALRRKGLCPHCGYDLSATQGGKPCPECGRPSRQSETIVGTVAADSRRDV